jgi:hypothetical protein
MTFSRPNRDSAKDISLPTRAGPSPDDDRRGLAINQALRPCTSCFFETDLTISLAEQLPPLAITAIERILLHRGVILETVIRYI